MYNMEKIITKHNKIILKKDKNNHNNMNQTDINKCKCLNESNCQNMTNS